MGWVSPTGHAGTAPAWAAPQQAYDENEATAASWGWGTPACNYSGPIVLTHDALQCTKIRFLANPAQSDTVKVELYYDGAWHEIYSGGITGAWQEVEFSEVTTSQMRFTFHVINVFAGSSMPSLYEVDFWEVPPPVVRRVLMDGLVVVAT